MIKGIGLSCPPDYLEGGILGPDPSGTSVFAGPDYEENEGNPTAEICIGGIIYLWSAIHDFRTLDRAVDQYNKKYTGTTIGISPTYFASQNAPGIAITVSF